MRYADDNEEEGVEKKKMDTIADDAQESADAGADATDNDDDE